MKGIDFDETFTLVTRLELIRILISSMCTLNLKLLDVKVVFHNGYLKEEEYIL